MSCLRQRCSVPLLNKSSLLSESAGGLVWWTASASGRGRETATLTPPRVDTVSHMECCCQHEGAPMSKPRDNVIDENVIKTRFMCQPNVVSKLLYKRPCVSAESASWCIVVYCSQAKTSWCIVRHTR